MGKPENAADRAIVELLSEKPVVYLTGLRPVGAMRQAMFESAGIKRQAGDYLFVAGGMSRVNRLKAALREAGISDDVIDTFISVQGDHDA